jgi:hypothetical protein
VFATISNRVNTFLLVLLVLMAGAILASRAAAGPLDPPAPPASTLPQVEPRVPISQPASAAGFPITISQPGSYFLTGNITAPAGKNGIVISADMVTLDLNGFSLSAINPNVGIFDGGIVHSDVVIRNGSITGGTFDVAGQSLVRSTFEDLRVTGAAVGLYVGSGNTIRRVTATENSVGVRIDQTGSYYAGLITDSNLSGNTVGGATGLILAANNINVRHNVIDGNGTGVIIDHGLSWLEDNDITGNTGYGIQLQAGGNLNTVVRNFITFNTSGAVQDLGSLNRIGATTSTASSTDTWSNIAY